MTEQAWSIKDLLYHGKRTLFSSGTQQVINLVRVILPAQVANHRLCRICFIILVHRTSDTIIRFNVNFLLKCAFHKLWEEFSVCHTPIPHMKKKMSLVCKWYIILSSVTSSSQYCACKSQYHVKDGDLPCFITSKYTGRSGSVLHVSCLFMLGISYNSKPKLSYVDDYCYLADRFTLLSACKNRQTCTCCFALCIF